MDADPTTSQSLNQKAAALHALATGPLAASTSKLSALSRAIPSEKDFHFFNNFPEFKSPAIAIAEEAESTLRSIVEAEDFWESRRVPVLPSDLDESYECLVNLNDELMEKFGASMDEFKGMREREEGGGGRMAEDGFQVVYGKRKKKGGEVEYERDDGGSSGVRVVARDQKTTAARSKVPFHIPTIKRPQQEFNILVNNSNRPFEHVWLERSEDGSRVVHPLEKLSLLDFVDRNIGNDDPVKPLPLESTPFKLVAGLKELKELVAKLRDVKEFAVDLEHNQYRSFQGLTCLMQISTRTEDFVIDTLKLRVHIGPYLREVFKDPTKRKVMHGADRDILWLQRDFGIYVCNLFDTGQASRVMQLERNSLEYLLHHFCEVNANKEYQNADWRLRPLPEEMVKYAREDTHYLLHIYDLMRNALLASSSSENDLLLEVYKRSYEVCMQLYEKEVLTDTSFLHIYGLQEADFNSKQLAIVFGLCEWRDKIAREEDESTGFILPNKALLEIARQMPLSSGKLRRLVKSNHQHVERHLNSVIGIIRSSVENSSSFERISEQLKMAHELSAMQNIEEGNSEPLRVTEDLMESSIGQRDVLDCPSNATTAQSSEYNTSSSVAMDNDVKPASTKVPSGQIPVVGRYRWQDEKLQSAVISQGVCSFKLPSTDGAIEKEKMVYGITDPLGSAKRASIPSVQISKKSSSAFGALLGSSSSRRKLNPYNGGTTMERDKNINMVEQIKSTVTLPFHTFYVADAPSEPVHPPPVTPEKCPGSPAETSKLEEVILLENESNSSRSPDESPKAAEGLKDREGLPEMEEGQMSLSDLSASFQQCFQSINERRGSRPNQRPQHQREVERSIPVKPFDYAAARKNMKFGPEAKDGEGEVGDDSPGSRLGSGRNPRAPASGRANGVERSGGFEQPRRRQAFPLSGNRSMTFH